MHHFEYNKNNIENTVAKTKIYHLSNYFSLTKICFFLNKCPYRILLIQLLKYFIYKKYKFVHPKRLKNKQHIVNRK